LERARETPVKSARYRQSANTGFSGSSMSIALSSIVERTWQHLTAQEQRLLTDSYASLEHGFEVIDLNDLNEDCFRIFCERCSAALAHIKANPPENELHKDLLEGVADCWDDFLAILRNDPRFNSRKTHKH